MNAQYYANVNSGTYAFPTGGQTRIDAHYDQSLFALVGSCNGVNPLGGNLEVRALDGSWSEVRLGDDELVLNCGEQLARLSNGTLHHAVHRVNNPRTLANSSHPAATSRISVMTYFQLDYDADVTPIAQCVPEGTQPKYPPSTTAECVLYTDPLISAELGYDVEAQKKMRIAQGLYDEDSNMMAIADPKDYTEISLREEQEADTLSAGAVGLVTKYRQQGAPRL